MKSLAVIAVATGVVRAELMTMRQDRGEQFRTFSARVRGKAETCDYKTKCQCSNDVDFTDSIIRDVLIAGIEDTDIRREVLGMKDILNTPVNAIVAMVEWKEMARNALPIPPSASVSSSSYRCQNGKPLNTIDTGDAIPCPDCGKNCGSFNSRREIWIEYKAT